MGWMVLILDLVTTLFSRLSTSVLYTVSNVLASHKKRLQTYGPILLIIIAVTSIFIVGWFLDTSRPVAGHSWADQSTYTQASQSLSRGKLPSQVDMHFAIGYPLLGTLGGFIEGTQRFIVASYVLFIASILLCYFAAEKLMGKLWALGLVALLLTWDGVAATMHFVPDLFITPWNNQVLFFAMSFFFWALAIKKPKKSDWRMPVAAAVVAGVSILNREETALFVVPLLVAYLFISKFQWKIWIMSLFIVLLCFLPQLYAKYQVFGSLTESGHDDSYGQVVKKYFSFHQLEKNTWETLIDSKYYGEADAKRPALLQVAPWLWIAPIGLLILLMSKKYPIGVKIFVIVCSLLILFYLSGANMSAQKLQFHCLRYISAGLIVLNLGVIVFFRETLHLSKTYFTKAFNKRAT